VIALGSAPLFALVPLAAGLRRDLHDLLREGATRAAGGRRQHRVQGTLVVTSVAFAFILLVQAMRIAVSNWSTTEADIDRSADAMLSCYRGGTGILAENRPIRITSHQTVVMRDIRHRYRINPGREVATIASDQRRAPRQSRRRCSGSIDYRDSGLLKSAS
jgi:hypothetical protein